VVLEVFDVILERSSDWMGAARPVRGCLLAFPRDPGTLQASKAFPPWGLESPIRGLVTICDALTQNTVFVSSFILLVDA
jgi:hypothetical protein